MRIKAKEKSIDSISGLTLKQLYNDRKTRPIVEPYMRKYTGRHGIKRMSSAFREIDWLSSMSIAQLDFDMRTNMGGGIVFEGWYEMIDKLERH